MTAPVAKKDVVVNTAKERDLYSWAVRQARLLREGRVAEIDAVAIAEEIDAMWGRSNITAWRARCASSWPIY